MESYPNVTGIGACVVDVLVVVVVGAAVVVVEVDVVEVDVVEVDVVVVHEPVDAIIPVPNRILHQFVPFE